MTTVLDLHTKAMASVDRAEAARTAGDLRRAESLYRAALKHDMEALALLTELHPRKEPSWSVMHASAASLAIRAGDFRLAEKLCGVGLAGDAADDVLDELRDLLDEAQYHRHLDLRGVQLKGGQFQITLSGRAIAVGKAPTEIASRRMENVRRLIERTAERKASVPFRPDGLVAPAVRKGLVISFSIPRAASYALTVSIEQRTKQLPLPLGEGGLVTRTPNPADVIADLFECVRMVDEGRMDDLRAHIGNDDYFANFVGLARELAPDGRDVKTVGFTRGNGQGAANRLAFRRTARKISVPAKERSTGGDERITGTLDGADGQMTRKGSDGVVVIVDDASERHALRVPKAILADIVRPRFGDRVTVLVSRRGEDLLFVSIEDPSRSPSRTE